MTWGSDATFLKIKCRYCGGDMVDDRDSGPTSHHLTCKSVPRFKRLFWRLCGRA